MEKRYKEIDGVRYQVIQNTILGSNVIPVGESLPEVTTSDNGKLLGVSSGEWTPVDAPSGLPAVTAADEGDVLTVNASGEWEAAAPAGGGLTLYGPYTAWNSQSYSIVVSQGNQTAIYLDYIENSNNEECDFSALEGNVLFIPVGYNKGVPEANIGVFCYPYTTSYIDDETHEVAYSVWGPNVSVHNDAAYTLGDYALGMIFMCSAEIPVKESGE